MLVKDPKIVQEFHYFRNNDSPVQVTSNHLKNDSSKNKRVFGERSTEILVDFNIWFIFL